MNSKINSLKYKKTIIVLFFSIVVLVCTAFSTLSQRNTSMETISLEAHYITYESAEELDKADLILIGTPIADFTEREHKTSYYSDGSLEDFYTLTEVKINKIIKSPKDFDLDDSNNLAIIEPVGIVEINGDKKITIDEYKEMEKGESYIIFLNKNVNGEYSVINNDFGKFRLDSDSSRMGKSLKQTSSATLKDEVMLKYRDFIE